MNERIQELLKQAGGIQHDEDGAELTAILVGKDLEKFAELIVKECMEVANTYQNVGGNCYVDDMIAKHFGVEE